VPAAALQLDHIIVGRDVTIRDVTIHQYFGPERRDPASRNRRAMLEKVWAIWITGVLQPSLPQDILLDLGLTERPAMVTRVLDLYVQPPERADQVQVPGTRLLDAFDHLDRALLILGAPGAGKTTLLLTLARDLLIRAAQDPEHPIPMVFPLSSWAVQRRPLADWLVEALREQYQVPRKAGRAWLDADQILPLLDGLDEVAAEYRAACVEAINTFRQEHGLLPLVVCSRMADYEAVGTRLQLQGALVVQPLTRSQVESYLTQVGRPLVAVHEALGNDPTLWELLDTPLMLTIVTLAYAGQPVAEPRRGNLSEPQNRPLFATYINRMFQRRGVSTRYTHQQTEHWLAWLAWQMTQHSQTVFYLERMQPDWLPPRQHWVPIQGVRLGAGLSACLLVGLLVGGLFLALSRELNFELVTTRLGIEGFAGLLYGGLSGLLAGLFVGGLSGYSNEITTIETIRWSWSGFFSELLVPTSRRLRAGLRIGALAGLVIGLFLLYVYSLPNVGISSLAIRLGFALIFGLGVGVGVFLISGLGIGLGSGLAFGLGFALIFGLPSRLSDTLLNMLAIGLLIGLLYKLTTGIIAGFSGGEITTKTTPNEGIYRSAYMALLSGLSSGLVSGLLIGLPLGPSSGLSYALYHSLPLTLTIGLATGIRHGGRTCLQHLALRLLLTRNGSAPWRYTDFLDYASERIFLRKVGGGYIFIHRLLQDYFVTRYTELGDGVHPETAMQEQSASS
jgi:eukaryotic-like serine/threonine-protein kinase